MKSRNKEQGIIQKYGLEKYLNRERCKGVVPGAVLEELDEPMFNLEREAHSRLKGMALSMRYPVMDPSFLSMTNTTDYVGVLSGWVRFSLPTFAVYTLDSSICTLRCGFTPSYPGDSLINSDLRGHSRTSNVTTYNGVEKPNLPYALGGPLKDAFCVSVVAPFPGGRDKNKDFGTIRFKSEFAGLIPRETRTLIKGAQEMFKGEIYIIAEAKKWEKAEDIYLLLNQSHCSEFSINWADSSSSSSGCRGVSGPEASASLGIGMYGSHYHLNLGGCLYDPLVVGVYDKTCYFINEFDCTPLDSLLKKRK